MGRTRLKLLLVGRGAAVPRRLATALADAGYTIARAPQTPVQLTRLLDGDRARGARGRPNVFAAELEPLRQARARPRPANGHGKGRDGLAMTLQALRESTGRTQGQVADRVAMTQPQLSRVEARRDHLISTVRKYVRALNGRVEVAALVNGSRIVLRDV
jgi:hypothetical protein